MRNESENDPTKYFPMHFLTQKWVAPPNKSSENPDLFFGSTLHIYTALDKLPNSNSTFCEIIDRLMLTKQTNI